MYGQPGSLCGVSIEVDGLSDRIFHQISWKSLKQKMVSYSAFSAEILEAADAEGRGLDLKKSLIYILTLQDLRNELFVDASALLDTVTTLNKRREYSLRQTIARLRDT